MVRLFDSYFCSAPSLTLSREQLLSICHLPFLSEEEAEESFSESHLLVGDKWIRGLILSPGPERWIIYFFFWCKYKENQGIWFSHFCIFEVNVFMITLSINFVYYFLCWVQQRNCILFSLLTKTNLRAVQKNETVQDQFILFASLETQPLGLSPPEHTT